MFFGGLGQFAAAQRAQQVAGQDDALPAPFSQALFRQEIGALLQSLFDLRAKAQVAQALATTDQLLIQPGGADHAGLAFYGQVGFQLHRHAAQALRVVLSATLGQVIGHFP